MSSNARHFGHDAIVAGWAARWRTRAVLAVLAVAVSILGLPVLASATIRATGSSVDAPGLIEGPFIADAGLVWASSRGVMLTNSAGRSTVLARPDAPNWDNLVDVAWLDRGWWAFARPSGVLAGRIGGPLSELRLLRRCNPGSSHVRPGVEVAQYAMSGDHLYAALPNSCLARRKSRFGEVLDINLHSRRWHVLAPIPGTLESIAASGKYLALAYQPSSPHSIAARRLLIRVVDDANGALVNQIEPPPKASGFEDSASSIQIDDRGDVLVTAGCCGASPQRLAHVAQPFERRAWWWAPARSRTGEKTSLGSDAVLSDGRVVFLSTEAGTPGGTTIELRNLLTGTTRTVVVFSGSAGADGLALSGNELAWAQQSTVVSVDDGPGFEDCKNVPLSPPELARLDLGKIAARPVVVPGVPIPSQYAHEPPCIRL
jgi:hypothetical protein